MKRNKLRELGEIDHSQDDFMKLINFTEEQAKDLADYMNVIANKIIHGEYTKSEAYKLLYETLTIQELTLAALNGMISQINSHFEEKEDKNNNQDDDLDKFLDSMI